MTSDFSIAVHALVYLNHRQSSVSSEELAENVCTHPVRIRKVLSKLRLAGFIATKEGMRGGYTFICAAETVTLAQIAAALQENPVCVKYRTGDIDMDCAVASGMAAIMDDVYGKMNEACVKYLTTVTIDQIDQRIFKKVMN